MKIKFITFEKDTGIIFVMLPELPENDFEEDGDIFYKWKRYASGIKWENADWEYFDEIEIENVTPFAWKYKDGEIIKNEEQIDED